MRKLIVSGCMGIALFLGTVNAWATIKLVKLEIPGHFTDKEASIYAQQVFSSLSAESISAFSTNAIGPPFAYTLRDNILTFIMYINITPPS